MYEHFGKAYSKQKVKLSMLLIAPFLRYFLLLKALKNSKIPDLFLIDLVSVEFHRSQKNALLSCFL